MVIRRYAFFKGKCIFATLSRCVSMRAIALREVNPIFGDRSFTTIIDALRTDRRVHSYTP